MKKLFLTVIVLSITAIIDQPASARCMFTGEMAKAKQDEMPEIINGYVKGDCAVDCSVIDRATRQSTFCEIGRSYVLGYNFEKKSWLLTDTDSGIDQFFPDVSSAIAQVKPIELNLDDFEAAQKCKKMMPGILKGNKRVSSSAHKGRVTWDYRHFRITIEIIEGRYTYWLTPFRIGSGSPVEYGSLEEILANIPANKE